ncbi:S8 family serine peptidase [Thermodesulfobacteriota bacterium]
MRNGVDLAGIHGTITGEQNAKKAARPLPPCKKNGLWPHQLAASQLLAKASSWKAEKIMKGFAKEGLKAVGKALQAAPPTQGVGKAVDWVSLYLDSKSATDFAVNGLKKIAKQKGEKFAKGKIGDKNYDDLKKAYEIIEKALAKAAAEEFGSSEQRKSNVCIQGTETLSLKADMKSGRIVLRLDGKCDCEQPGETIETYHALMEGVIRMQLDNSGDPQWKIIGTGMTFTGECCKKRKQKTKYQHWGQLVSPDAALLVGQTGGGTAGGEDGGEPKPSCTWDECLKMLDELKRLDDEVKRLKQQKADLMKLDPDGNAIRDVEAEISKAVGQMQRICEQWDACDCGDKKEAQQLTPEQRALFAKICCHRKYGMVLPPYGGESVGYNVSYDSTVWCEYDGDTTDVPTTPIEYDCPGLTSTPRKPEEPTSIPEDKDEPTPTETDTPTVVVKATQTVLEDGQTTTKAMPGQVVRLNFGADPGLPIAGEDKDDAGHDASPVQGVTGEDGTVALQVPSGMANSGDRMLSKNTEVEIDATPQNSQILHFDADTSKKDWDKPSTYLHPELNQYVTNSYLMDGTLVVVLTYPKEMTAAVNELAPLCSDLEYGEPNYCRDKQGADGPDDPYFKTTGSWGQAYDDQWAIKRVGYTKRPKSAWRVASDKVNPVVVAVIDTGLDWNHQDISWENIWKNKDEIPGNKIDDDKNGYIDDVIGWNFWDKKNSPWDRDGHGTFVTGIIAATQNNGIGIAGINPYAKIMVLKALNDFGHTRASFVAEAVLYATNNGARVINMSLGGKNLTRTEQMAIDYAYSKGVVIVAASGNEAVDVNTFGPAGANHVITVGSSNINDKHEAYSNWGFGVDLVAPGMDVLSLRARRTDTMLHITGVDYKPGTGYVGKDKRYYRAGGTSFSAPIVAGTASLILSRFPELTNGDVGRMLLHSARDIGPPGVDFQSGYGLLNAVAALKADPKFYLVTKITGVKAIRKGNEVLLGVLGTVDADQLDEAWIEIGSGKNPKAWKRVSKTITKSVKEGQLDAIPARHFRGAKQWIIRLIGKHKNGTLQEARFNLQLG